ncbi:hypothetical protein [Altericroceibacterium xinjiangense]|uniref:hypothetical protein n=1 Tax=Altericroceibacterium xinjiangense TaxID=762261 RepID=UPI000F7E7F1F|nr:hypothetical protein [Altericroceibacterium xinjiangense]
MGEEKRKKSSSLEWIAGIVGSFLTLSLVGLIVWQDIRQSGNPGPVITVHVSEVEAAGSGYRVEFVARNITVATAASVEIEGALKGVADEPIVSHTNLSYVPGKSERKGGLYFPIDPSTGQLEIRALGYSKP